VEVIRLGDRDSRPRRGVGNFSLHHSRLIGC